MQVKRFSIVALLALCVFPWEQSTNAAVHAIEQPARVRRVRRALPQAPEPLQEVVLAQEEALQEDSFASVMAELESAFAREDVEVAQLDDAPGQASEAAMQEVKVAEPPAKQKVMPAEDLKAMPGPAIPAPEMVTQAPAPAPAEGDGFSLARAFSTSTPVWLVLIFAFLWGILVSFTPCVYPLIPITAAVLQSQATTSATRNFALAASYVLGTAVVYTSLGYLVASTTIIFGQWAGNPWVIGFVVAFLLYLALSMFGYYEIYIPRFLVKRTGGEVRGSLLWSFVAGIIAGTVASPCLSPALITVLLYVSTLGNPVLGFLTLFSFSMGMGILLLIVGTSSAALSLLPRAGTWLYEVKNVFGYLLLLLAVYFISINPSLTFFGVTIPTGYATTAGLVGLIALLGGLYYLRAGRKCLVGKRPPRRVGEALSAKHTDYIIHCTGGYAKIIIGLILLGSAALLLVDAYLARCGMAFLNLW